MASNDLQRLIDALADLSENELIHVTTSALHLANARRRAARADTEDYTHYVGIAVRWETGAGTWTEWDHAVIATRVDACDASAPITGADGQPQTADCDACGVEVLSSERRGRCPLCGQALYLT